MRRKPSSCVQPAQVHESADASNIYRSCVSKSCHMTVYRALQDGSRGRPTGTTMSMASCSGILYDFWSQYLWICSLAQERL